MSRLVRSGGWRGALVRKIVLAALSALIAGLVNATASAAVEQPPTTVAGLLGRYYDLSNQAERVNEELLLVQENLQGKRTDSQAAAVRAQAARTAADVARGRASQAQDDQSRLDALIQSSGDLNAMSAFLNSSSQADVIAKMQASSMASQMSGSAAEQGKVAIADAEKAARDATAAEIEARRSEAAVSATEQQVTRQRDELTKQIAAVKATLDSLTPQQKAILQDTPDNGSGAVVPKGNLGEVVKFALSKLGLPYLWGGTGPQAFDCSGLMQAAYRAGGLQLPRVSIEQSTVGQAINRADVRAGDMIFYYSPVHHVAMAIDNKRAVHAPDVGQNIRVSNIDAIGPITVIRRVMN
ncbi:NlpC/P60 family protein [Actinocrispum wychmicini]|uniref:Cell wall-associated NlpC family hydrolase n=1 Tax=Actinocrispum wychmicini TaxID=1213861 RepID=A0A4R2II90_9PSEU|nr:NlpC/P60 family protein [Actinocrispum wychmicini]TCO44247.1 cell wall-associated NlpC family hydrolase [Actinocrispum wychmicini]